MSEKKSLEEQISKLTLAGKAWVEPMRQWLKQATDLNRIAKNTEPCVMKQAFSQIEGLNLFLKSKKAQPMAAPTAFLPPESIWVALRASLEKAALTRRNSDFFPILVPRVGFEPTALGLEVLCSIQLSYQGVRHIIAIKNTDGMIGTFIRIFVCQSLT